MRREPLISVIIPAFNAQAYLSEAVESVLGQSRGRFEVIVVDDGSTDDTVRVAERYSDRVRYLYQENRGVGAARMRGVSGSRGPLLAFLDSDDRWVQEKTALQLARLEADPRLEAVFGHARQFLSPELDPRSLPAIRPETEVLPAQLSSAMLIRRDAFERVGSFEVAGAMKRAADVDWFARAVEAGLRFQMIPEVVYERRIHETNQSRVDKDLNLMRVRALKAALDRRRGSARRS